MDQRVCAWRSHRQGLDGSLAGVGPAEVFERTGWARSLGGDAPYLTLFARSGISREQADAAIGKIQIQELPCARGCTYVVPASDFPLALAAGRPFSGDEMKVARKLGVTDDEIDRLRAAVVNALADGPLSPDELRTRVGDATRNLGPEGVKKGITTTLPVALGLLQSEGDIRRVPVNGRIDRQSYRYAAWRPSPLAKWKKTAEESFEILAGRFFSWIGPAAMKDFQAFSGLSVKAAKAAITPLKLIALDEGDGESLLLHPQDEEAFRKFKPPRNPQYALLSALDNVRTLARDPSAGTDSTSAIEAHLIVDRGQLAGKWEFDPDAGKIVWISFVPPSPALKSAVLKTETYIREELGDARSFSLDSPKSRKPRLEALRNTAAAR